MAGYLGKQVLMTSDTFGTAVQEYSTITLNNGTVITASQAGRSGAISLLSHNFKTDENVIIDRIGGTGSINLLASKNGGFVAFYHDETGTHTGTAGIVRFKYDASGTQIGSAKTIVEGAVNTDTWSVAETSKGYAVTYFSREIDPDFQRQEGFNVAFFAENGKLQNTFDVNPDVGDFLDFRSMPSGVTTTELTNGNSVVAWSNSFFDPTPYYQIVKSNGTPVGSKVEFRTHAGDATPSSAPTITANPDGGFTAIWVNSPEGERDTFQIQHYSNTGKTKGALITIDALYPDTAADHINYITGVQAVFLADGSLAIAWSGPPLVPFLGAQNDVFFSVVSKGGNLIVGPQLASDADVGGQSEVSFTTLRNGNVLLTFRDDNFKNFSYEDSVQGRQITLPDSIWEGNSKDNAKTGTDGNDVMLGLRGDDSIDGGKGGDFIKGGAGADRLFGNDGADDLQGEEGGDDIFGGKGDDTMSGGAGGDTLNGDAGNDHMNGGEGNDRLVGGGGADQMQGGAGNDILIAGSGGGTMNGGDGVDKLTGGSARDNMYGDAGKDTLKGQGGDDFMEGGIGNDRLFGGSGNDVIHGEGDNDLLKGGTGDDFIFGGDGNDKEYGNAGNDQLYDSMGDDLMFGGGGADVFNFLGVTFGHDIIRDFEFGVDTLDMGFAAMALENAGDPAIKATELANGVRFKIDADNWVLVKGATLSDFLDGDFIINNPFG